MPCEVVMCMTTLIPVVSLCFLQFWLKPVDMPRRSIAPTLPCDMMQAYLRAVTYTFDFSIKLYCYLKALACTYTV